MMTISSVAGLTANCTWILRSPPRRRALRRSPGRSSSYCLSVSVCWGRRRCCRRRARPSGPGSRSRDDHHVVGVVAHDLELELAPTEDRLLEQDLGDRARAQAAPDHPLELLRAAHHPSAAAAERERRAERSTSGRSRPRPRAPPHCVGDPRSRAPAGAPRSSCRGMTAPIGYDIEIDARRLTMWPSSHTQPRWKSGS